MNKKKTPDALQFARRVGWLSAVILFFSSPIFAYGGFTRDASDYFWTYWFLGKGGLILLAPYFVCSFGVERMRYFIFPWAAFLIFVGVWILPNLITLGEIGPSHVAVPLIGVLALLLCVVITAKYLATCVRVRHLVRRPAPENGKS